MTVITEPLDDRPRQVREHINFALIDDANRGRRPHVTFEIQLLSTRSCHLRCARRRGEYLSSVPDGERTQTYSTYAQTPHTHGVNSSKRHGDVPSSDNSYDASDEDSSAGKESSLFGSRQKTCTCDIDSLSVDPDLEPQAHKRRKVDHIPSATPLDPTPIPSYMHEESHVAPRRGSNAVLNP
ncbi:hypothetical protein JB92DRAFT_1207946 [Gautieria morchelliformis]|nr:hypothetical protein JB92DRAFT_1207946 [Gautieria morchelliformis]